MSDALQAFQHQRDSSRFDHGGAEIEVSVNAEHARACGLSEKDVQARMMQDMQGIGRLCLSRAREIGGRVRLIMNFMKKGLKAENINSHSDEIFNLHFRDIRDAVHILTMFRNAKDITGLPRLLELYPYQTTVQELQNFHFDSDDVSMMVHEKNRNETVKLLKKWREEQCHFNKLALYHQMLVHHVAWQEIGCTADEAHQLNLFGSTD